MSNKKRKDKRIKVYVCSSLKPHNVKRVDKILARLVQDYPLVDFFRPYGTDPSTMMETVREDVREIRQCDELWQVGSYGRDSSWELGLAYGLGKRIKIFRDWQNSKKLASDEMIKIGLDELTTEIIDL